MHFILCDEINSGKSSFCIELVNSLIRDGFSVSGWVTPAHMIGDEKIGHDFIAIGGGKIRKQIPFTRHESFQDSFQWRKFYFNNEAFKEAGRIVKGFKGGFFIVDEIGPLELEDHLGFYESMLRVFRTTEKTLTVVRKGLEKKFTAFFPECKFIVCDINKFAPSPFPLPRGERVRERVTQ